MAVIYFTAKTEKSVTLYISDMSSTSTYTEAYLSISGNGVSSNSSNLARAKGNTRSDDYTFTGLTCGRIYTVSFTLKTLTGSTGSGSRTDIDTSSCPIVYPGSLTVNSSYNGTSINVYGQSGSDTTSVRANNTSLGSKDASVSSYSSYSISFTGVAGQSYGFYAWGKNANGDGASSYTSVSLPLPPNPGSLSLNASASGTTINVNGYAGSDTTSVRVRISGYTDKDISVTSYGYYSTSFSVSAGATYTVHAWGKNNNGDGVSSSVNVVVAHAPPTVPTNFRVTSNPNNTSVALAWNASTGATSYTVIPYRSSNNVKVNSGYSTTSTTLNATGLENGVNYYFDLNANGAGGSSGNVRLTNILVGFTRPNNWDWAIDKRKGLSYNVSNSIFTNLVSHSEITGFQIRINQFRSYKLGANTNYVFTSITNGSIFTSTMYNQLESAISGMSPPTATYGQRASGSTTYGVDELLNRLRDSLNSIT